MFNFLTSLLLFISIKILSLKRSINLLLLYLDKTSLKMYIHTTQAAELLNIAPRRLLTLLNQGRVVGAYKSGRCWIIPTFDGLPKIIPGLRGRRGSWKTQEDNGDANEEDTKTIIHVNSNRIRSNNKKSAEERKPVIVIRGKTDVYVRRVEIPFPCQVVYHPDDPLHCGAKVWIEVLGFDLTQMQPPGNILASEAA